MLKWIKDFIVFVCRDVDGAVIRPLPRSKRMLSEPSSLPHLVQLLLTFDPSLVDKVVTLLNNIMEVHTRNDCLSLLVLYRTILFYLVCS